MVHMWYMHTNQNSLVEFRSDNTACLHFLFHSVPYTLPLNTTLKCVSSVESGECFQMQIMIKNLSNLINDIYEKLPAYI